MNELAKYEEEKTLDVLRTTVCKGLDNDEIHLFAMVCKNSGLDPFSKQIYPVKRWDSKLNKNVMTIQTGIDGLRLIAERTGRYAPGREPTFVYDKDGFLLSATSYVKKQTKDGTWHEVSATAFYAEYFQKGKDGSPLAFWEKMPHNQLAKCAESLVLRKAFPAELSGVHSREEMDQARSEFEPVPSSKVVDIQQEEVSQEARYHVSEDELEKAEALLDSFPDYRQNVMSYLDKTLKTKDVGCLPIKVFKNMVKELEKMSNNPSEDGE